MMAGRWRAAGVLALFLVCMVFAGCGRQEPVRQTVLVMDTVATLTATGPEAEAAVSEGVARLRELEVSHELHIYCGVGDKLGHVFHLNMKSSDARRCNDDECTFFKRFL